MARNNDLVISPVETVILKLLNERMMYGYEIIRIVNERTDGAFAWKEGTVYPSLHRLEIEQAITAEWVEGPYGKPRKFYKLTKRGESLAQERMEEWKTFSGAMDAILSAPAV